MNNFFWSYPQGSLGYGALYNWYAASNANFAPSGWHVPTNAEWTTLTTYLGGTSVAGGHLKEIGTSHWQTPNTGADNSSGFNAFAGGYRTSVSVFNFILLRGYWWSSTPFESSAALNREIYYNSAAISSFSYSRKSGMSVRLIKNDSTDPGTLTDYDGNVYSTTNINGQIWITSNWKCEHLNDGTDIPIVTDNTAWSKLTTMGMCYYGNQPNVYK